MAFASSGGVSGVVMRFRISRSATERVEVEGAAGVYVGEDLQGALGGSLVGFDPFFYAFVDGFVVRGVGQYLRGEGGLLVVDVVAQGRARERAPAVVAGERLDVAAQPVEPQPIAQDEVDGRCRIQRLSRGVGHVGNIQRGEHRAQVGGPLCQIRGTFASIRRWAAFSYASRSPSSRISGMRSESSVAPSEKCEIVAPISSGGRR